MSGTQDTEKQKIIQEISPYMGLTGGLIATLILFGGIGYFIDKSNESYPFWTSISAAVGAVIAIINFIRKVLMFSKADEERKKKERLSRLENEKD